jgi:molybdopterin converting factor small subunit
MTKQTHVLLFGKLRQYVPAGKLAMVIHSEMTPQDFREAVALEMTRLCPTFPGISELESSAVATDRLLSEKEWLGEAVEVSLLPPVCGG